MRDIDYSFIIKLVYSFVKDRLFDFYKVFDCIGHNPGYKREIAAGPGITGCR